ncbi:hypothetical protein SUDANB180_07488 [Streptomyces sp. enrichment culture]
MTDVTTERRSRPSVPTQPDQLRIGVPVADTGHDRVLVVGQRGGVEADAAPQPHQHRPPAATGRRQAGVQRRLGADHLEGHVGALASAGGTCPEPRFLLPGVHHLGRAEARRPSRTGLTSEATIRRTPRHAASSTVSSPTGPRPTTATLSASPPRRSACSATEAGSKRAACSSGTSPGSRCAMYEGTGRTRPARRDPPARRSRSSGRCRTRPPGSAGRRRSGGAVRPRRGHPSPAPYGRADGGDRAAELVPQDEWGAGARSRVGPADRHQVGAVGVLVQVAPQISQYATDSSTSGPSLERGPGSPPRAAWTGYHVVARRSVRAPWQGDLRSSSDLSQPLPDAARRAAAAISQWEPMRDAIDSLGSSVQYQARPECVPRRRRGASWPAAGRADAASPGRSAVCLARRRRNEGTAAGRRSRRADRRADVPGLGRAAGQLPKA